jgi:hypothetical protein
LKHLPSFSRPTRSVTIALVSAAAGIALGVPGLALATTSGQDVPAPPAVPTSDSQIQNIDQVKTAIKGYYGDTTTTTPDPVSAPTCTTIQYKSLTRQHIESLGVVIVANVGDQYSDLKGGFADSTYKIPNPMYYLP